MYLHFLSKPLPLDHILFSAIRQASLTVTFSLRDASVTTQCMVPKTTIVQLLNKVF